MQLEEYKALFLSKKKSETPITGLVGRVLRGKKPEDFITLTDEPENRKIILLMAGDGLELLLGKAGNEILLSIGYEQEYIKYKVESGNKFKVVVFEEGGPIKPAIWDNVAEIVSEIYPEYKERIYKHLKKLKTTPYAKFQKEFTKIAGKNFRLVDREGSKNPFYMTAERFKNSKGDLLDMRRFLYNCVHLSDLFSGDGYTYDEQGKRGLREYIAPNKPLDELGKHILIDMPVELPNK
jgi:hypothetical protein